MKNDTSKNYDILADLINMELVTSLELLDLFINWHGLESLTDEFMEFVKDEIGY